MPRDPTMRIYARIDQENLEKLGFDHKSELNDE